MKRLHLLAAALMVVGIVNPVRAGSFTVTDTTTATDIFKDDGFEDDTLTDAPNAPAIGSYSIISGSSGTNYSVLTGGSPGQYDGSQYLYMHRDTGAQENTARLDAVFSSTPATGDTIKATFAFLYESTTASSVAIRLMSAAGNATDARTRATLISEADYGETNWYSLVGAAGTRVNTSRPLTPGTWQTIGIEYTTGSTDLKLTVNGVTETLTDAANAGTFNRIRFTTAASNSTFYLDAVPNGLAGDYDHNGIVNAADYVMWRKDPATFGGDPAGYSTWRENFGSGSASGAGLSSFSVPEPNTAALLGAMAAIGCVVRGARERRNRDRNT